jgi:putative spermidine/putrescine transport system substrate-binding protein/spermidine/putrescine transport system substrate-binding protein
MFAKTRTQGENFDIVFPDSSSIQRYVETELLRPLDRSRLPNLDNMLPLFQDQDYYEVDGELYAVPFTGGATPIVYNTTLIPDPESSWGLLWNEDYAGQLGMLDDSNNSIVIAALYLGLDDPFNLSDAEFEQVKEALVQQSFLIRKYITGEDELISLLASGEVLAAPEMEPGIADELNEESDQYVFAQLFPDEGALAWVDNMVIPVGSPNPDLAYAFMNFALTPTVQAGLVSSYSFLPVIDVEDFVDDEAKDRVVNLADFINDINLLQAPEDPEKRVQIWTEVRAGG